MPSKATADSPLLRRLNAILAEQAREYAVIDRNISLTYAQLDAISDALAGGLADLAHPVVGLYMDRSALSVVAAVAAAKAGVAYVPMGLDWPMARCADIAKQCRLAGVLGERKALAACPWAAQLPHIDPADFLESDTRVAQSAAIPASLSADTTLYIMHTSGSTGTPKGVCVHHAGIHDIFGNIGHLGYVTGQRMVHGASMTFDMSIMELWGGLLNGCTLYVSDPETLLDAVSLGEFLRHNSIGLLLLPTSVFNVVCSQNPAVFRSLQHLCFGGELPDKAAIESALEACPNLSLHNCYGPTECSVFVAAHTFAHDAKPGVRIPAGKAIGSTRFLVVGDKGETLPAQTEGELVISGICVANGYVQNNEKSSAFFTLEDGSRAYKSGDRACLAKDGTLYILGRTDDQIKISGCRIEPGEVCAALLKSDLVHMAYIGIQREPQTSLVAYVVPASADAGTSGLKERLRDFMHAQVPDYMVPRHFVFLDKLPLNSSGKIDKTRLPRPEAADISSQDPVLHIFRTVLEDQNFMPEDSFLEAGGSSIMAARLIASLREHSGVAVPFSLILEPQTAARASLYIENARLGQHQARQNTQDTSEITARL